MRRALIFVVCMSLVGNGWAEPTVLDPDEFVVGQLQQLDIDRLVAMTPEQAAELAKKAGESAEAQCLNWHTAQAALAGGMAGELVAQRGSWWNPLVFLKIGLIFLLGKKVIEAIKEKKIRAECAAAGAAVGFAISYLYFYRKYRPADPPVTQPAQEPAVPDVEPEVVAG